MRNFIQSISLDGSEKTIPPNISRFTVLSLFNMPSQIFYTTLLCPGFPGSRTLCPSLSASTRIALITNILNNCAFPGSNAACKTDQNWFFPHYSPGIIKQIIFQPIDFHLR